MSLTMYKQRNIIRSVVKTLRYDTLQIRYAISILNCRSEHEKNYSMYILVQIRNKQKFFIDIFYGYLQVTVFMERWYIIRTDVMICSAIYRKNSSVNNKMLWIKKQNFSATWIVVNSAMFTGSFDKRWPI